MTGLFIFLAVAASLVSSVFGIWLTIKAFRTSIGWGLAALFLPFALWIYGFMHWDECRKPMIGQFATIGASFLFIVLAFVSAPSLMQPTADLQASVDTFEPQSGFSQTPAAPAPDPGRTPAPVAAPRPAMPDEAAAITRGLTLRPDSELLTRSRRPLGEISLSSAPEYLGDRVRITDSAGNAVEGDLVTAQRDRLVIEKRIAAGVVTFEFPSRDIDALEVIRR